MASTKAAAANPNAVRLVPEPHRKPWQWQHDQWITLSNSLQHHTLLSTPDHHLSLITQLPLCQKSLLYVNSSLPMDALPCHLALAAV